MKLLIIGALEGYITEASHIAMKKGAQVSTVTSINQGVEILRNGGGIQLVMVEDKLDIRDFIKKIRSEHIAVPVLACGLGDDPQLAAQCVKDGAVDYVPMPPDADLIAAVLENSCKNDKELIFADPIMKELLAMAKKIAPSQASVLITGASGTGKEVMAHFIHKNSKRKDKAFIAVNCAAIPENLIESELFGHEKGAFTGAQARRIGKFEEANGGTLLLDEISEMDTRLQAKLLRAIQEREIDRVGGARPISVDVRILATSNRNLAQEVAKNSFREDLLFRLNVVSLQVPSLAERQQDIVALAKHFNQKFSKLNEYPLREFSDKALQKLQSHHWQGNVRELENIIHRAVLMADGDKITETAIMLDKNDVGKNALKNDAEVNNMVGKALADVEREAILQTLEHCEGDKTHAAIILGVSIRTLQQKLQQYMDEGVSVAAAG
ncbi:MAG: sigma-54 dependent transcriptional regulator [Alphaproteobacteria bacterium]|nr:sigma-54 dependent transcriptional regulator [Alphaproteobacteria bacterium]